MDVCVRDSFGSTIGQRSVCSVRNCVCEIYCYVKLRLKSMIAFRRWPNTLPEAQRGLTLIETLVATLILAFAALAQARLSASIIDSNRHARGVSAATVLAQAQIETIRTFTYANIVAGSDGPFDASGAAGTMYSRAWTVADDTPVAGAKTVSVTITWADAEFTRSIALQTIVAD